MNQFETDFLILLVIHILWISFGFKNYKKSLLFQGESTWNNRLSSIVTWSLLFCLVGNLCVALLVKYGFLVDKH